MDEAPNSKVCEDLRAWKQLKTSLQVAGEGEYMVTYPSSLLLSTPEKLCVELFKEGAGAELSVEVFDSHRGEEPYLFDK